MQTSKGLTLIEVLVALAIIGVAMTAIIKATSQNIRATNYLQDKTIALLIGQNVINEVRVHTLTLPRAPDARTEKIIALGQTWYWRASNENTPNKKIKKINVSVFAHEPADTETVALSNLESYTYAE